jgi:hypothetical protein
LTVVLTGVWMWVMIQSRGNPYLDVMALLPLVYTAPFVYAMRYTYLKTRWRATQALAPGPSAPPPDGCR